MRLPALGGALLCVALVGGCIRYAVPPLLAARERAAADLALRDYRRSLPLPDPYARAGFCLLDKSLIQYADAGLDAGGLIDCDPPPPAKPVRVEEYCTEGFQCLGDECSCFWRKDSGA